MIKRDQVISVLSVSIFLILLQSCGYKSDNQMTSEKSTSTLMPSLSNTSTDTLADRYIEKEGGFSYIPPNGWRVMELLPLKYKIIEIVTNSKLAPFIYFDDEISNRSLDEYAEIVSKEFIQVHKETSIISQGYFITIEGQQGLKVVYSDVQNELHLYQINYYFSNGERKLVAIYSRVIDQDQNLDNIVDYCMKTIRFE